MEGLFSQTLETTQEEGSGCLQIIFTDSKTETTCKMGREAHRVFIFAVTTWQDQGCWKDAFKGIFLLWRTVPWKIISGERNDCQKKKEKEKKPPNCSWPNASQVGQYQASAGGLGPLPSQCLIKPASFPDQGIKVWVICIDFVCCHAEPVMLISAIHKFPFKMSPLLHFLHDPSILQPEGTLMIPKGCRLVWKTLEHCTSPEFSPISTVGREWVRRVVRKILNNNNNKKNLAKIFLWYAEGFFLLVQRTLANG